MEKELYSQVVDEFVAAYEPQRKVTDDGDRIVKLFTVSFKMSIKILIPRHITKKVGKITFFNHTR